MQGKKKLSKFFKDEKLSLLDKQKTLLLCSDHQVVWVINHRADNRFKLTKQTQDILKIKYQKGGTYIVMEGPQFSSLAESNLYRSWKADVIGMTNMPEAKLAREAEIRYTTVAMVTDFDCWHPDHENVEVQMIIKTLMDNAEKAKNMIKIIIEKFESKIKKNDPADNCLDTAIITNPKLMTKRTKKKLKNIAGRVLFKK